MDEGELDDWEHMDDVEKVDEGEEEGGRKAWMRGR